MSDLQPQTLIPRKLLFGNPERTFLRISPDGKYLSYLAPYENVLNIWVAPANDINAARPVTHEKVRAIRDCQWAYTGQHILYPQDQNGDENWHVYAVNVEDATVTDLTPLENVQAQLFKPSAQFPNEVVIGLNNRVPQLHDLYRVNISTGERTLLLENPGFAEFKVDDNYVARFGLAMQPDGSIQVMQPNGDEWALFMEIPNEDALLTNIVGFDKDGGTVYITDSRGRDTAVLAALRLDEQAYTILADDPQADISEVVTHPTEKTPLAAAATYARKKWESIGGIIAEDLAYLATVTDGDFQITSQTTDNQLWTIAYIVDNGSVRYYLYDRAAKKAEFLFSGRPAIDNLPLAKMHPVVIRSRDGLNLVSYYTLPYGSDTQKTGIPDAPVPLVLLVHGGPWGRDEWGYNPFHQWAANRGYAVLSVNFRASTGFGKAFVNAGDMEWGRKMQNDLDDAVDWAVAQGITTSNQVAILGGSYGGYAVLAGLTLTPDRYVCGVDIVGPSNLQTLIESIPPYWEPMVAIFRTRMGDNTTEEGRALLAERSPLTHVGKIKRPLLIAQGANDPRVKQSESDQIVSAMNEKGIPVVYTLYPDEGHGFARQENWMSFVAITESFLATHLEGAMQPIGDDFTGSSVQFLQGIERVPGAEEALPVDGLEA